MTKPLAKGPNGKPFRGYLKHGLTPLLYAARGLPEDWVTQLGAAGVALRAWQDNLVASLGGPQAISAQQAAVIALATRSYLLLESVDRYLLALPSLVNKQKRALFPVVTQRQQLSDGLLRSLTALGLERRALEIDLARALAPAPPDVRPDRSPGQGQARGGPPPVALRGAQAPRGGVRGAPARGPGRAKTGPVRRDPPPGQGRTRGAPVPEPLNGQGAP